MAEDRNRLAAIKSLEAHRQKLAADISIMQQDLMAIERTLQVLRGQPSTEPVVESPPDGDSPSLQAVVDSFLREHPGAWFTTTQVIDHLIQRGIPLETRSNRSSIAAALQRAEAKGLAEKQQVPGKKRFLFRLAGSGELPLV